MHPSKVPPSKQPGHRQENARVFFCCAVFLWRRKSTMAIGRHARHGAQPSEPLSRFNKSKPPSLTSAASMFLQPSPTTKRLARLWSEEDGKAEKEENKRKEEERQSRGLAQKQKDVKSTRKGHCLKALHHSKSSSAYPRVRKTTHRRS